MSLTESKVFQTEFTLAGGAHFDLYKMYSDTGSVHLKGAKSVDSSNESAEISASKQ